MSDLAKNRIAQLPAQQVTRWQRGFACAGVSWTMRGGQLIVIVWLLFGYCLIYFACANFRSNTPVHEPYSLVIKTAGQSIARQQLLDKLFFALTMEGIIIQCFPTLIPIDSGYQGDIFTESRAIAPYLCRPGTAGQWSIKGHHITGALGRGSQHRRSMKHRGSRHFPQS